MDHDSVFPNGSISRDTVPSAPYSYRPPSPPFIHVPVHQHGDAQGRLHLMQSYEYVDAIELTSHDLEIITGKTPQTATDRAASWTYEQRREAQSILDFLYLGPMSAVRDHGYLQKEGISKILVARDSRLAAPRPMSVEKAATTLGIDVNYVDVEGPYQLIQSFPEAIRLINDHLLAVYHSQAQGNSINGQILAESVSFRRGKVLLVCETGNDRSAAIVAAYIMAVFGGDMVKAVQYITVQRFCCSFDEDIKRTLQTWEDILRARSAVAMDSRQLRGTASPANKRGRDDTVEAVEPVGGNGANAMDLVAETDGERFMGRRAFTPFQEGPFPAP